MNPSKWATASARPAIRATLSALTSSLESNTRAYVGLAILVVIIPLADVSPGFFDRHANTPWHTGDWFHINTYYFLLNTKQFITQVLLNVAVVLFIPPHKKYRLLLLVPLVMGCFLLAHTATITSNEEYLINAEWISWLRFLVLVSAGLFIVDHLIFLTHHRFHALCARIEGIQQSPGLSSEEKIKLQEPLMQQLRKYHLNY